MFENVTIGLTPRERCVSSVSRPRFSWLPRTSPLVGRSPMHSGSPAVVGLSREVRVGGRR
jgi:hypothetical protein